MGINTVAISGRAVADPDVLRHTAKEVPVVNFRMAFDQYGTESESGYIGVVAWGKTAEFVSEHVRKGARIAVDGKVTFREWGEGDKRRSTIEINSQNVDLIDWPEDDGESDGGGY